jgi:hypothetical protein
MSGRTSLAVTGFVVQLVPLSMIVFFLFVESKPPDYGNHPGVMASEQFARWVFPYSIALGLSGAAAVWFRTAATAAALLMTISIAVAFGFGISRGAFSPGPILAASAFASIVGWTLRAIAERDGQTPLAKTTSTVAAAAVLLVAACGIYLVIQLTSTHS